MKKILIILSVVLKLTTVGLCQKQPTVNTITHINGLTVFPVNTLYNGSITVANAITYINNYNVDKIINKTASSFVFSASDLLSYLTEYNGPIDNFFLAEGPLPGNQLYLLIAPIDNLGQHYYYSNDNNVTCYVLSSCQTCPNVPTTLEYEQSTITTYYLEAMSFQKANTMISAYNTYVNTPGQLKITTSSWLYNGLDLIGYIQNGITNGMKYVQFTLGVNSSNKIDLIISGSSDGNTHMYYMYNGDPCVMENCYPCPQCKAYQQGTALEPNCGK